MDRSVRTNICCALGLALATLLLYWGVLGNDFINYDDTQYVIRNSHVSSGLSWDNVVWAFTSGYAANWHPLTWLSHMVDVELFSLDPWGHHLVSLVIHCLNAVLLFLALQSATGARWRSLVVAALFAVHPLHVESVAWVAERKDVLSTCFGFLALLAYLRYARSGGKGSYCALLALFAMSLMAKPMLVTLPFVLLLIDYWPLRRLIPAGGPSDAGEPLSRLVLEKLPLFALSAISSCITFVVQARGEAVHTLEVTSTSLRFSNALVSYAGYLRKALWPRDLAVLYPLPKSVPPSQSIGCAMLLLLITWGAVTLSRKRPYLLVGWLWFLGTLVPVIGIVQVGLQSMADRYTYVPLVGIFIAAVWGLSEVAERCAIGKVPAAAAVLVPILALSWVTWNYQRCWRDGKTLFARTIAATTGNYYAHYLLGTALAQENLYDEALAEFAKARQIDQRCAEVYINSGVIHAKRGENAQAIGEFRTALSLNPRSGYVHYNLALALDEQGQPEEAVEHYREVLLRDPANLKCRYHLGVALSRLKRCQEATAQFSEILRLDPEMNEARRAMQLCGK